MRRNLAEIWARKFPVMLLVLSMTTNFDSFRRKGIIGNLVRLILISFFLASGATIGQSASAKTLKLEIDFSQASYAIREPIRITARLTNVSRELQHIIEVGRLTTDMEFMYLRIVTPTGEPQYRAFRFTSSTEFFNPNYVGEPLKPGETIELFLYPNVSGFILHPEQPEPPEPGGITFPVPGEYEVQLVYFVPAVLKKLHDETGTEIYSDPVTVSFRLADAIEREILDACWESGGGWISMGDNTLGGRANDVLLKAEIDKYPDHAFTKYAMILFIRSKTTGPNPENEEALAMVDDLMKRYTDFRIEEVRQLKATNLRYLHRWEESLEVLEEAIEINPLLRTNYQFMWQKVTTQYGTHKAVRQWKANRLAGKANPDEGIVVTEE